MEAKRIVQMSLLRKRLKTDLRKKQLILEMFMILPYFTRRKLVWRFMGMLTQ